MEGYHKGKHHIVDFPGQELTKFPGAIIPDNAIMVNNLAYIVPKEGALKYMTRQEAEKNRDNAVYLGKNKN